MRYLAAFVIFALSVAFLSADPPQRVRVSRSQQFLATQFLPLQQIQVPNYGAGYQGGVSEDAIKALTAAIEKLNANLGKTEAPKLNAKADLITATATALFTNRCASCHEKGAAAKNGGGVVLMDGGAIVPLSKSLERDLIHDLWRGKMPKSGKALADSEFADVMEYLYEAGKK